MPRERNTDYQRISQDVASQCQDGKWKLYVIAAEGDKTEYQYFKNFKEVYHRKFTNTNLRVEYIDRLEPSKSSPQSVSETIKSFYDALVLEYDIKEYDEFWMIIDTDDYENRRSIILELLSICDQKKFYYLGLSNPCFEIWLILHFVEIDTQIKGCAKGYEQEQYTVQEFIEKLEVKERAKVCKRVLSAIHQEKHQPYYEKLIEYIPQAIPRAKKLEDCDPNNSNYPDKIGTTVYQLLEKILNECKNFEI